MRICLVTNDYPINDECYGSGYHTYYLAHSLRKNGHSVTVITTSHSAKSHFNDQGVDVFCVRRAWPNFFNFLENKLRLTYRGILEYRAFSKSIAQKINELEKQHGHFDLVEIPDCGGIGYHYLKSKKRSPVVLKMHSPIFFQQQFGDHKLSPIFEILKRINKVILKRTELFCYRHADHLIAPSEDMQNVIKKFLPPEIIAPKTTVIPNAIDTKYFHPKNVDQNSPTNKAPKIITVSRISKAKGIDLLIEVALKTLKEIPEATFHIIGKDTVIGASKESYKKQLIKKYHLEKYTDRIIFQGYKTHDQILKAYHQADAFIFTSRMESFGIAVLEALACGLPTIAYAVGGIPEIIEDQTNGLLIPPFDGDTFTLQLVNLLKNPEQQQKLQKSARKRAEKFNIEDNTKKMEEVYHQIIAK